MIDRDDGSIATDLMEILKIWKKYTQDKTAKPHTTLTHSIISSIKIWELNYNSYKELDTDKDN